MTLQEVRKIKEEVQRLLSIAEATEISLINEVNSRSQWSSYKDENIDWQCYDVAGMRSVGALKHAIVVAKHMLTNIISCHNKS